MILFTFMIIYDNAAANLLHPYIIFFKEEHLWYKNGSLNVSSIIVQILYGKTFNNISRLV